MPKTTEKAVVSDDSRQLESLQAKRLQRLGLQPQQLTDDTTHEDKSQHCGDNFTLQCVWQNVYEIKEGIDALVEHAEHISDPVERNACLDGCTALKVTLNAAWAAFEAGAV